MNQLVIPAHGPVVSPSPVFTPRVPAAFRTQARVSSDVKRLCGGPHGRRIFVVNVANVGSSAWNDGARTHALRCRVFSWERAFLQELPSRRLPRVEAGEAALAAIDVVMPMTPGGYALSIDVIGIRADDLRSPLLLPVEVHMERELPWNPRGLITEAFRVFTGAEPDEQALGWWESRLRDGAPVESLFASFEDVAGERFASLRERLVARIPSFAPCAQNAQTITD
jgi:hypothetical protein